MLKNARLLSSHLRRIRREPVHPVPDIPVYCCPAMPNVRTRHSGNLHQWWWWSWFLDSQLVRYFRRSSLEPLSAITDFFLVRTMTRCGQWGLKPDCMKPYAQFIFWVGWLATNWRLESLRLKMIGRFGYSAPRILRELVCFKNPWHHPNQFGCDAMGAICCPCSHRRKRNICMHSKKVLITAQIFISGMMAFLMTGFFSILNFGMSSTFVDPWVSSFIIAWPVAFCFSLVVSPLAFMMAGRLMASRALVRAEWISLGVRCVRPLVKTQPVGVVVN